MTSLLLPESPLIVLPSLATAIGLEEAIVLQQLYYLLLPRDDGTQFGKELDDGHRYVFFSYEEMRKRYFPFMSEMSLRRAVKNLETQSLLISKQPDGTDRRKYYRVCEGGVANLTYERLNEAKKDLLPDRSVQIERIEAFKLNGSSNNTKTTDPKTTDTYSDPISPSGTKTKRCSKSKEVPNMQEGYELLDWFLKLMTETGSLAPTVGNEDGSRRKWAECFAKLLSKYDVQNIKGVCRHMRLDDWWSKHFLSPFILLKRNKDEVTWMDHFLAQIGPQTRPPENVNMMYWGQKNRWAGMTPEEINATKA